MDKVQGANSGQSVPLWERQKSHRGHKTSVDGALQAHRKRVTERQARIEKRLNIASEVSSRFFPKPQVAQKPVVENQNIKMNQLDQVQTQAQIPEFVPNIRELDSIYSEAQVTPISQQAMHIIEKDISANNPEEAPEDEIPRGSYVDYVV